MQYWIEGSNMGMATFFNWAKRGIVGYLIAMPKHKKRRSTCFTEVGG